MKLLSEIPVSFQASFEKMENRKRGRRLFFASPSPRSF
jgi:hypothetical protein